jgi:uncharacterized protein with PIN domain
VIGYVDTSAFVPLLINEPTSEACRRFWDDADVVVSSRLLYVETAAALAQARRMGRLTGNKHLQCADAPCTASVTSAILGPDDLGPRVARIGAYRPRLLSG